VAVFLAALVLLAGCGTSVEHSTPGEDPSATPTPTTAGSPTATAGPGLDDVTLPAGVSEDGVTDTGALLSAHAGALEGKSAKGKMDFRLEVNDSGQNVSFLGKVTPGTDTGWMRVDLQDGVATYYTEGDTTYERVARDGQVAYRTNDAVSAIPSKPRFGADIRIRDALEAANWTATGVTVRGGERLVRFEATDVSLPDSVDLSGDSTVESGGVLLVDQDGVVRYVSVYSRVDSAG
jgi:uncharacterized protein YceK